MRSFVLKVMIIKFVMIGAMNSLSMAQGKTIKIPIEKYILIDTNLASTLDSLKFSEKKCPSFDNSLIWLLSYTSIKYSKCDLKITMISGFVNPPKGYFYRDSNLYIIFGEDTRGSFKKAGIKKDFELENNNMPHPEDYSTWFLDWQYNKYTIRESYPLPCD